MSRYIDADKFAEKICEFQAIDEDAANAMIWLLRTFPTADVVEVRHGEWVVCGTFDDFLTCSVCKSNKYPFGYDFKYCPECGAKMDGERREK